MAKILIKLSTQDLHRKRQFKQKEKQSSWFGRERCILAHLDRKSKDCYSYPCNCTECRFVTTVCRAQIGKTQWSRTAASGMQKKRKAKRLIWIILNTTTTKINTLDEHQHSCRTLPTERAAYRGKPNSHSRIKHWASWRCYFTVLFPKGIFF